MLPLFERVFQVLHLQVQGAQSVGSGCNHRFLIALRDLGHLGIGQSGQEIGNYSETIFRFDGQRTVIASEHAVERWVQPCSKE
jgi:hypothetical protein